ncbi:MAG: hypothetical protein Q8Q18_00835 [bacterium]|nr:hypothetical protein [bacterium]
MSILRSKTRTHISEKNGGCPHFPPPFSHINILIKSVVLRMKKVKIEITRREKLMMAMGVVIN